MVVSDFARYWTWPNFTANHLRSKFRKIGNSVWSLSRLHTCHRYMFFVTPTIMRRPNDHFQHPRWMSSSETATQRHLWVSRRILGRIKSSASRTARRRLYVMSEVYNLSGVLRAWSKFHDTRPRGGATAASLYPDTARTIYTPAPLLK